MKSFNKSLSSYFNTVFSKAFVILCCFAITSSLISCNDDNSLENKLVSEINIEEFAQLNLPDFYLLREIAIDSEKTEYVFKRDNDGALIFIRIGLYHSAKFAEENAKNYVNSISVYLDEGQHQGVLIGENFWWDTDNDPNILTTIVFTRRNALFDMSCSQGYSNLKSLAIKIDNDIKQGESYIKF